MNDVSETPPSSHAKRLDARGLWCPEPALQAKQALANLASGECLEVWTTDPMAPMDLEVLADRLGHRVLSHSEARGYSVSVIEKA